MSDGSTTDVEEAILLSAVPGRVRLKVFAGRRRPDELERVRAALDALPGVSAVQASTRTGSVLVRHEPASTGIDELRAALEELGLALVAPESSPRSRMTPARRVFETADQANSRVERRLGGPDLRLIFPAALGLLSLRQATRDAPGLAQAPWYVLAWYAFDSFLKLNGREATRGSANHLPPQSPPT